MKKIKKLLAFMLTVILVAGEFAGTGISVNAAGDGVLGFKAVSIQADG